MVIVMRKDYYNVDPERLTQFANQIKELITHKFNIPDLNNYLICVHERGFFGKCFDKITRQDAEELRITIIQHFEESPGQNETSEKTKAKILSLIKKEEDENRK
jgi:predicted small metal-binding protein